MDSEGTASLTPTPPTTILGMTYGTHKVELGTELTPTIVKDEPILSWETEPEAYYTLIMLDPDAPSRKLPVVSVVNHWLVTNIQGNDIATGDVISVYYGSGPPKYTGLHRYIFFVYKQPSKLEFDETKSGPGLSRHRLKFSLKKFVKKYDLGAPLAGNYFRAKWDPYVDQRNRELGQCTIL